MRIELQLLPGELLTARFSWIFALLMSRLCSCSLSLWLTVRALDFHLQPQAWGPITESVFCWLSTRSQWLSIWLQLFPLVWSCLPAPTLLPFSIPVLIIGSFFFSFFFFGHQTPILFSPVYSGESVPESWSQDKGFSVLTQSCFCLFLLKTPTFSTL